MNQNASLSAILKRCLAYGPHDVEVVHEHLLHDQRRDKEIPLRLYVPRDGGQHPVIVFSHGAGDSNATSPLLLRHWASHGYVVIAPTHLFGARPLLDRSILRLREELSRPREMGPEAWRARTEDISAVMDALETLGADVPAVAGRIDASRLAVAGHSFGAYTVMLLGGATLTDPTTHELFRYTDSRPRAVMLISGPGCDQMGITQDSWKEFTKPSMVFAGSRDPGYVFGAGPMWRAEPYTHGPPGDKYLVYIRGAHHLSYVGPVIDIPSWDPGKRGAFAQRVRRVARAIARFAPVIDQVGIFDYARIASVAFWHAYLKNDAEAKNFLHSHTLDRYSARNVRTEAK